MDTLMSIMNYNGGILREAEVRSILELRIALDSLAIRLWLPEAKDEEIHLLRSYVEALKTAKTTSEAAEFAFRFQHELAFLSGNTLIPLIFTSLKYRLFHCGSVSAGCMALNSSTLTAIRLAIILKQET